MKLANVKMWPLLSDYHIHNEYYAVRITDGQSSYNDTFPTIDAARKWAIDVLVAYFDWSAINAENLVDIAHEQMELTLHTWRPLI